MTPFKIRAVFLEVVKHLLNPRAALVGPQPVPQRGRTGRQEPRLSFARFPPGYQMHGIAVLPRQLRVGKPPRTRALLRQAVEAQPDMLIRQLHAGITLLGHHIAPLPLSRLFGHCHSPKFAVCRNRDCSSHGEQPAKASQQRLLLGCRTVSARVSHRRPTYGTRTSPMVQRDHQQLMPKPDLGVIRQQAHFQALIDHLLRRIAGHRFVLLPDPNGAVAQTTSHAARSAHRLRTPRYVARYATQIHAATGLNPGDNPREIPQAGDSFIKSLLSNPLKPSIINTVEPYVSPPVGLCLQTNPTRTEAVGQPSLYEQQVAGNPDRVCP